MKTVLRKISFCAAIIIFGITAESQNTWSSKASLTAHGGRTGATGFSIGHYGFIGGGFNSSGNFTDFWRWNQDSNTWTAIASYPGTGRFGITSFTINGKGYCCLGGTGSSNGTDLWEYDTTTNKWTAKASFPGTARFDAFVFVLGTKAYIGGGAAGGGIYYNDVWVYDAIANTWKQLANFGGGNRAAFYHFTLNGYGYAGGGSDGSVLHNDLWKYDTAANSWTSVASLPVPGGENANSISFVIDTLAYAGTGNKSGGGVGRDFWAYSATTNTWSPIATLPGVGRQGGVGFTIKNKGYAATGQDSASNFLSDFWEYSATSATGINSMAVQPENIKIYPNPGSGLFTVSTEGSVKENIYVELYNITGEKVHTEFLKPCSNNYQIDLSNLPDGVYFAYIISNKQTQVLRFVKE